MHPNDAKDGMLKRPCGNSNWSTTRDSKEGVRTEMGTQDRKARLAVLEKAHAPTAGLSYMQAQITNSKTSMSAILCFQQPGLSHLRSLRRVEPRSCVRTSTRFPGLLKHVERIGAVVHKIDLIRSCHQTKQVASSRRRAAARVNLFRGNLPALGRHFDQISVATVSGDQVAVRSECRAAGINQNRALRHTETFPGTA